LKPGGKLKNYFKLIILDMLNSIKNIIIISIDDLRVDCINSNPNKKLLDKFKLKTKPNTPALDWFINNGVFFNNCITVAPYTTAAHASILTGQWPAKHRIIDYARNKLACPTVFSILKREGFTTLFQSDFPYILGPNLGFTNGIDKFVVENEDESIDWMVKNKDKRRACFFHFASVHFPYGFLNLKWGGDFFRNRVKSLLEEYEITPDQKADVKWHFAVRDFSEEEMVLKQNYAKVLKFMHKKKLYSKIMDLYIEGINFFEKGRFSRFVKKLQEMKMLNDSLIVILGDHGEAWDEHNEGHTKGDYKDGLIDDIIKVPLIFVGPKLPKKLAIDSQVRTIDIVPTILSLMGLKRARNDFDGQDLSSFKNLPQDLAAYSQLWHTNREQVSVFLDQAKKEGKLPKLELSSYLATAAVRMNKWKLVQNFSKEKKLIKKRLFNVNSREVECADRSDIIKKLNRELAMYNSKTYRRIKKEQTIASDTYGEIAGQLRTIGYNI